MKIKMEVKGDDRKARRYLKKIGAVDYMSGLHAIAQQGVVALSSATPIKTGRTANSWNYEIRKEGDRIYINWNNNHIEGNGVNIALILQLGHGTGTGGWVAGRDYINPTMRPFFDKLADSAWKEVTRYG